MQLDSPQIDTRIEIVTPENIAFQYRLAGPFRRSTAMLIDYAFRGLILFLVFWIGALFSAFTNNLVMLAIVFCLSWFIISWFYGGIFETYWNGQSPGKWLTGIRVVGVNGQPIQAWQAVARNVLREVDLLPYVPLAILMSLLGSGDSDDEVAFIIPLGLVGLISCSLNSKFQRLGDLACGTIVIVEEQSFTAGLMLLREPAAMQYAAELPLELRVTRSMAKTLAKYVQRRMMFTPLRRMELARRLGEPLRHKYPIRADVTDDLLLCAIYFRTFIADAANNPGRPEPPRGNGVRPNGNGGTLPPPAGYGQHTGQQYGQPYGQPWPPNPY